MRTKLKFILTLLTAFTVHLSFAQQAISGTVTDQDGLPLPGVNIMVKGTTNGTQTDFDGNYTITASSGDVLVYTYIGMTDATRTVGANTTINLAMQEDAQALDEVVVTALGISREEKSLGYSSQQLESESIADVPTTNVVNALSGKIAGVNITQSSGDIGSSSRITVRGVSTIFGNSQPLIVVDGAVVDNNTYNGGNAGTDVPNGLADINPQDIESINVLKGGEATALYGMRGTNGVLVITTKTGKKGKALGISINSTVSFSNPYIFPDYQNEYGQGHSPDLFHFIDGFGYDEGLAGGDGGTDESWGPRLDAGLEFVQFGSYIQNPDNPQPLPWVSYPNSVVDNFYQTGLSTDNTVALSGGTESTSYRLSLGLTDATGIVYNTDLKKYNIAGNVSFDLNEKWSAGFSARYTKSTSDQRNGVGYGEVSNQVGQLVWSARQVDWSLLKDWRNLPLINTVDDGRERLTPLNWNLRYNNNPFWALDNNLNPWERNRFIATANIGHQFNDKFRFDVNTAIDYFDDTREKQFKYGTVDFRNGYYQLEERNRYEVNSQAMFSYNDRYGANDQWKLNMLVGGQIMVNKYSYFGGIAQNLVIDNLFNLANSDGAPVLSDDSSEQRINSLYGTGSLSYNDNIYLNFSGRNDWASVLPIQNNSVFYPAVSTSALVHDILNIESQQLNFLKLRASWAQTGSAGPLSAYSVNPVYELSGNPLNGSTPTAFVPNTAWNSDIKAQTETAIEAGIETRLFQNRINLNLTYYNKKNEDVIMPLDVSSSSGFTSTWKNAATITNEGVEAFLGIDVLRSAKDNGLNLGLDINFAKNVNEVSDIEGSGVINLSAGGLWNVNTQARNGESIGAIFGPAFARDEASGKIIYENGLPVIGDNKILGNSQPDWVGGVGINASFKGFRFRTLFDAKIGGEVYSQTNTWGMLSGILEETVIGRESGIIGDGVMSDGAGGFVPNNVVVPAIDYYSSAFNQNIAESSVYDATFVKWRELSLSYDIPRQFFENIGVQSVNLGVNIRNLAVLYRKAPHIDPETAFGTQIGQQGLEYAQTPATRTIGVSLNVNF
ncbi:SusC/RagA family TonB-linked outer membrane protein [Flavobacterium sp. ASW18X]|uniref:SusC/RagA family TonB-linked outer membrane protein n=1 Tax=Flavobacterium sp. ASW18X TaxID=2572595 RepID=UPI0010AE3CC5|nr:SusC/RagA family TonB-linked outer membrane protein [Flavobacterium sp. ASW18X]TKD61390.1 SusC/RagA family TonB-linked outer membrane protein [Flavobacterium sp. ASW18X]